MSDVLAPGTRAPAFELPASSGAPLSDRSLLGHPYVLVFYPGDFTPVCTSELALFEQARGQIEDGGARLLGVSVDSVASHVAFAKAQGLSFALLSDAHPKGAMSTRFGAYNADAGYSRRALFVVDGQGTVAWSHLSPDAVNPGANGVLEALARLQPPAGAKAAAPAKDETDGHFRGDPASKVTLLEYGDYQCPYCGMAYHELKKVLAEFGEGLRFGFRNFPLTNVHPYAELAAEAAEAAAAQGRFWPMHDALYEYQTALGPELIVELSQQLGLDTERLTKEVNAHAYRQRVTSELREGLRQGVNGTPTFFINGSRHEGPFDARTLIRALRAAGLA